MSHYFDSGVSVRKPMWHKLGKVRSDYPTSWEEFRGDGGILWEAEKVQNWRKNKAGVFVPCQSFTIVRDDTEEELGTASEDFEIVSNKRLGEIAEAVLAMPNMLYETCVSLRGGKEVAVTCRLDEPMKIGGSPSQTFGYLSLINAHHAQGGFHAMFTNVQVVCWNTAQACIADASRRGAGYYTFRHTAGVNERIDEAKDALRGLRDEAKAWKAAADDLFGMSVDDAALETFLTQWLPDPVFTPDLTDEQKARRVKAVEKGRRVFRNIYLESMTVDGNRGTALGLVDTAIEWDDYYRAGTDAGRMRRAMIRPDNTRKIRAVEIARRVAR